MAPHTISSGGAKWMNQVSFQWPPRTGRGKLLLLWSLLVVVVIQLSSLKLLSWSWWCSKVLKLYPPVITVRSGFDAFCVVWWVLRFMGYPPTHRIPPASHPPSTLHLFWCESPCHPLANFPPLLLTKNWWMCISAFRSLSLLLELLSSSSWLG